MAETAVKWYATQAMKLEIQRLKGEISTEKMLDKLYQILEVAQQMEKEQMLDIYIGHNQYNDEYETFEEYYKETYINNK